MLRRNRWLIFGLLATAGLSWWLFQQQSSVPAEDRQAPRPDFFLDDFVLIAMDEQGVPKHRVSAPHMVHYRDDDSAEVQQPFVEIFRADLPDWQIRAQRGWIGTGASEVQLTGDVVVQRLADPRHPPLTLRTEMLQARPDDHYLETDQAVTFLSPGWKVQALGMRSWLNEGRTVLLSEVRGIHEPETP